MATILQFQYDKTADDEPVATTREEATTAEIIIFPGVRIERYENDPFGKDTGMSVKSVKQD